MTYYLGLDLGTGSLKTVLFDREGLEIAASTVEYPLYQPHNGWSEQDPEDWYQAALTTVKNVMDQSGVAPEAVRGLGISGQMMGAVMLNKNGEVLRRAILWNDGRTSESCEHVRHIVGDDLFMKYSLTPARPGLTAAKIQWVKENQPMIYSEVAPYPSAEGLPALPSDRRVCHRGIRRVRHTDSRCPEPEMVRRDHDCHGAYGGYAR